MFYSNSDYSSAQYGNDLITADYDVTIDINVIDFGIKMSYSHGLIFLGGGELKKKKTCPNQALLPILYCWGCKMGLCRAAESKQFE